MVGVGPEIQNQPSQNTHLEIPHLGYLLLPLSTTSSRLEHQRTGNNFQVGNEKRNISNIQNLSPTQKAFQSNLNVR
uniref:Uncharacterized protein n=1 Tax=Salix viminalis TaxID=40686 RepID=A0A6N2N3W7_SALVM